MMYRTIALELIQDRPGLYEELRSTNRLIPALDAYAIELKERHDSKKEELWRTRPWSDPSQIASEAMELTVAEFQERLPSVSAAYEDQPLSLDAAMNYIRRHTPPA